MIYILDRLRQAREQRGYDLDELARRTRLRVHLLEALEQGRFDALPRGVYARALIRTYASAVGLEPNNAVAEVAPLLPAAEDPIDGIARVRGFERSHRLVPELSLAPDGLPPIAPGPAAASAQSAWRTRLSAASARLRLVRFNGLPEVSPMAAGEPLAAAADAAILSGIAAALLYLSASAADVTMVELMHLAGPAMAMLIALIAGLYFLLLGGIGDGTFGTRLAGLSGATPRAATLPAACRRAGAIALRELSIVVDLILPLSQALLSAGTHGARRSDRPLEESAAAR